MKGVTVAIIVAATVGVGAITKAVTVRHAANRTTIAPNVDLDDYLDTMAGFLRTPPRDGVFGESRIPKLHGERSSSLPGYSEVANLEGRVSLRSVVVGLYPKEVVNGWREYSKDEHEPFDEGLAAIRISDVHEVTPNTNTGDAELKEFELETDALKSFAVDLRKKAFETRAITKDVNGRPTKLVAKAVKASSDSCYKCHTNVKKGEPIGYVMAIMSSPNHKVGYPEGDYGQ